MLGLLQIQSTTGTALANVADVSIEVETDSGDEAVITVGQLTSLLQNYTAMSVRPCFLLPAVSLELFLMLISERLLYTWSCHCSACHEAFEATPSLVAASLSFPCPLLQYAQNSQGVLGWGIQLLAIGVSQPTNATTTLPCQNQFGK